jgi:hypothetical protein
MSNDDGKASGTADGGGDSLRTRPKRWQLERVPGHWQVARPPRRPDGANYQALRDQIRTGDLLLFRGKKLLSGVIEHLSDSPYSHVAILAKWHGRVLAFQADLRGVEVLPASRIVYEYDGGVDWWALRSDLRRGYFDERMLFDTAITLLGIKYGYLKLLGLGLKILFGRALKPGDAHATPDSLFCSQFVSLCYRKASGEALDVNPKVNDESTSPADFARSGFFEPRWQLHDGSGGRAGVNLLDSMETQAAGPTGPRKRVTINTWTGLPAVDPPAPALPAPSP